MKDPDRASLPSKLPKTISVSFINRVSISPIYCLLSIVQRHICRLDPSFFLCHLLSSPFYNLSLPPSRTSDPGSHSRLFSPASLLRLVPCIFIARRCQLFLPSPTRIELHPIPEGGKTLNHKDAFLGEEFVLLVFRVHFELFKYLVDDTPLSVRTCNERFSLNMSTNTVLNPNRALLLRTTLFGKKNVWLVWLLI